MAFDLEKFRNTNFTHRVGTVEVPALAAFFDDGEKPIFKVRGLTGQELGYAQENSQKRRRELIDNMVEYLIRESRHDVPEATMKAVGFYEKWSPKTLLYLELLIIATIEPKLNLKHALKICENFAIEFAELAQKIMALTGQGRIQGELKDSGETLSSESP